LQALETERILLAQLAEYKSDFEMERQDRAEARGQLEEIKVYWEASERDRRALINQLRDVSKIAENQKNTIQTMLDERLAINMQFGGQRQVVFPRMPVLVGRGVDEPDSEMAEGSSVVDPGDRVLLGDRTSPLPGQSLFPDEPLSVRFNAVDETDYGLYHSTNDKRTTSPPPDSIVNSGFNLTESSPLSRSALHGSTASRQSQATSLKMRGTRDT